MLPSDAPIRISLVEAVGCEGFQAIDSICTPFRRANGFGVRECVQIVVLALGGRDDKVGCRRVQEQTSDKANLGRLLGEVDVVNVFGTVKVESQDTASREGENQNVIGDLGSDKIRGYVEAELDSLYIEDGQRGVKAVRHVAGGGSIAA
jgi:hypothetical protein